VRAVEIAAVVRNRDGLRVVFRGANGVGRLREELRRFVLRKSRMQERVGKELQAARQIFRQELGVDYGVVGRGFAFKRAADVVEIGGKLLRGAGLRAFAQQLGGDRRQAFLPAGISDG